MQQPKVFSAVDDQVKLLFLSGFESLMPLERPVVENELVPRVVPETSADVKRYMWNRA